MRNRSRPSAQSDGIFCHPLPGGVTIPNGRLIVGAASWGNVTDLRNALIAVGTCHNAVHLRNAHIVVGTCHGMSADATLSLA